MSENESPSFVPKWRIHDELAQKHGLRKAVISVSGHKYSGEWAHNQREGQGTQVWASGKEYRGEWKNDERSGEGSLWKPGKGGELRLVYEGQWNNNKMHGIGKYYFDNANIYEGHWSCGARHGRGKMTYTNGDVYDGAWMANEMHGQGTLTLANGNYYEGTFCKNKKHGRGTFFYVAAKQKYEGEWAEDMPRHGVLLDWNTEQEKLPTLGNWYFKEQNATSHVFRASNHQQT